MPTTNEMIVWGLMFLLAGGLPLIDRIRTLKKNPNLKIDLTAAEYEKVLNAAAKNGEALSDYVRNTVLRAVEAASTEEVVVPVGPKPVPDAIPAGVPLEHVIGGSLPDATHFIPGMPKAPARTAPRSPIPGVITESERTDPRQRVARTLSPIGVNTVPPGPHPCALLNPVAPPGMKGQCQGSCRHKEQLGKPCYWAPTSARQCPKFEPPRP